MVPSSHSQRLPPAIGSPGLVVQCWHHPLCVLMAAYSSSDYFYIFAPLCRRPIHNLNPVSKITKILGGFSSAYTSRQVNQFVSYLSCTHAQTLVDLENCYTMFSTNVIYSYACQRPVAVTLPPENCSLNFPHVMRRILAEALACDNVFLAIY